MQNIKTLNMKKNIGIFLLALAGGAAGAGLVSFFNGGKTVVVNETGQPLSLTSFPSNIMEHPNFVTTSAQVTPAVVHIKTKSSGASSSEDDNRSFDPFKDFFGGGDMFRRGPQEGSGSGVIIKSDGYIITNNHVIEGADKIEVVLNDKRSYNATLVGTDKSTDIALIKIEEDNLPTVKYGNSDNVQVGEWVLAVGNPFNLTSTVTAGIVSAKARNIGIFRGGANVESFIQTDAAVNPGNSGGALVSVTGELVGINTAIASQTGSFAGYSFAVPINLAKKVVEDLMTYGNVQRGFLGVQIMDVNADLAEKEGLKTIAGVYVQDYSPNSAAEEAGIKKGDVIVGVSGKEVKSTPELQEIIGRKRPGDKVEIKVNRDGSVKTFMVTLRDGEGKIGITKKESVETVNVLGGEFESLSSKELKSLKINNGLKVKKLNPGKLREAGVREGFIITKFDDVAINSAKDLANAIKSKSGGVLIEGVYPNGSKAYYGFGL